MWNGLTFDFGYIVHDFWIYVHIYERMCVRMYERMCVRMYERMYVRMYGSNTFLLKYQAVYSYIIYL